MHVPRCVWLSVLRVCGEGACSPAPSGKPRQLPLFVFNGLSKDPLSRAAESFCTLKKDGRKGGGAGASVYVWIPGSRRWGGLRKALRICTAPLGRMLIAQARSAPACPSPEPSLRPSPHPLLSKESHHLPPRHLQSNRHPLCPLGPRGVSLCLLPFCWVPGLSCGRKAGTYPECLSRGPPRTLGVERSPCRC